MNLNRFGPILKLLINGRAWVVQLGNGCYWVCVVGCGLNMGVSVLSPKKKKTPSWTYPFGCGPTQLTDLLMTTYDIYNIADGVCIVK